MGSVPGPIGQRGSFVERVRREQLVSSATETLAELGYRHASLAEIARRAGVSKSLVLYHFAGKDELVGEVVRAVYAQGAAFLAERVDEQAPPRTWLRDYLTACVRFLGAHRSGVVALGEILGNHEADPAGGRFTAQVRGPHDHVAEHLRRGTESGAFRAFSVPLMARAIRSVLDDLATQHRNDPELDLELCAAELVALFDRATRGSGRRRNEA